MLNCMNIYFYSLIFVTGALSIYTDIRERKIRNIHLAIICFFAFIVYFFSFLSGSLKITPAIILNPLLALIIGFVLYVSDLWRPGDAKLFFTYCLLLPNNLYYLMVPLSCFVLLINIFLTSFVLISLLYIVGIINSKSLIIKKFISLQALFYLGQTVLITLCLSWVIQPLTSILPIKNNIFLNLIIIFCGYSLVYRFMNKIRNVFLIISVLAAGLILRFICMPYFFTFANFVNYLKYTALYSIIFYALRVLIDLKEKEPTRIPLSPFMLIGALLANTGFLWWLIRLTR